MIARSISSWLIRGTGTLALMTLGALAMEAASDETQQGVVKSMSTSKIVLTTSSKELTFTVNASTQISVDGKPAKADDIQMGDYAAVTISANTATRIDAQGGSTPGTPDPLPR